MSELHARSSALTLCGVPLEKDGERIAGVYAVDPAMFGTLALRDWCAACGEALEHIDGRHAERAEDGDAAPVMGCLLCEQAFPEYFAEAAAARASWEAARRSRGTSADQQTATSDHERGHPERPAIGLRERVLGEGCDQ